MSRQASDNTIASIQQILDRDDTHLAWRVLSSQPATSELQDEPFVYVHARTHDFHYRCRIARLWTTVNTAPTLRLFVAEVAA